MRRFFSRLWAALTSRPTPQPRAAEDVEFTFLEPRGKIPEGLRNLRIERLPETDRYETLLLRGFDADLTAGQIVSFDRLEDIAWASRAVRWAAKYHERPSERMSPIRLHRENVLLLRPGLMSSSKPGRFEKAISDWLAGFDWSPDRPMAFQQTSTDHPVENGFFRCVRVLAGQPSTQATATDGLVWEDTGEAGPIVDVLTAFARDEESRRGWVEEHLRSHYENAPPEQLTHPAFALIEFPHPDGEVELEFAGSIWSPEELRFWSRAVYLGK